MIARLFKDYQNMSMETNKVFNEDCLKTMARMPDCFIDLTVTSPPYDNLRTYNGYLFDFESVAKELYRVTKQGGVVVWIVGDQTKDGSESGTSFRQALYFNKIGFNLADTMIYHKGDLAFPKYGHKKYPAAFEYMFVLSKGRLKTFNLIKDRKNKLSGKIISGTVRQLDGTTKPSRAKGKAVLHFGSRSNVWSYSTGRGKSASDDIAFQHPAIFPEKLANDHIVSWSNEGDLVYDPFSGSGTTAKMSILNKRRWIVSEISSEYCDIINKRLEPIISQPTLF